MATRWPDNVEEFLVLDGDQQEELLLAGLSEATDDRGRNFVNHRILEWFPDLNGIGPLPADVPTRQKQRDEAQRALLDAYFALEAEGSIRPDPSSGKTFCVITRKGEDRVAAAKLPDAARVAFAARALNGVDLHPALQGRQVDTHFGQGKFETALRDGSTFLEDAVRNLVGPPGTRLVGVKLMGLAFGANGKLREPALPAGEADALRNLYAGFFGAVRNVVAHRDFKFASHKEAFEALLMLDYLTEKLEVAADRLGQAPIV